MPRVNSAPKAHGVAMNTPTYYEVVLTDGNRRILVGYTLRRACSRSLATLVNGKLRAGDTRIDRIAKLSDTAAKDWLFAKKAADGAYCGAWRLVWSGRTEREARSQGELPDSIYHRWNAE